MYITARKRRNKKDIRAFYLYVCESHRVDGEVKNTQRYFGSVHETDLLEGNLEVMDEGMERADWKEDEIEAVKDKLEEITQKLKREQSMKERG